MCPQESHSSFCSPFSHSELLAAASNLSSPTATGPDKIAYPMLKHLPRAGMDFLLHIFNLSWTSHFFPSIWKTSSITPIHKMGKLLDSPASFRPISFTTCVSKLFERIVLSHLLFFLESNSILSSCQAGFCLGRSTLDQILYLSQFISDGFNKHRPGSRTILSTIDFSKAFDSGILLFSINLFRLASFLLGNDAADELAKRGALLASSAIPCYLSLLISCIHPSLFSDWRHTISSKFLDMQVPLISTEEHVLPRHACCVLSRLHCNVHSLLLSSYLSIGLAESRILLAMPADTRPRILLISVCTVKQRTLCAAHSSATLCLSTTSGPDPGELPSFWGFMVFHHAPIPSKGSGKQQQQQQQHVGRAG